MQNTETLFQLGFKRIPEWDFEQGSQHYKLERQGEIWRAYVVDYNGPVHYVSLGKVVSSDGKVDRWRDCCSKGSVLRKIENYSPAKN